MDTSFDRQTDSVEWYTPPHIVRSLGGFDLDPCAPVLPPNNAYLSGTVFNHPKYGSFEDSRARAPFGPFRFSDFRYTTEEGGLDKDWEGRVWMNPPYGRQMAAWMKKLSLHSNGIALVFARTETQAFFNHVWGKASGMFFFKGRLKFHQPSKTGSIYTVASKNSAGAPSVLISYDEEDSWANANALKNCGLPGYFVDLTPTEVIWAGWKAAIRSVLEFGPLSLTELYEWVNKCVHRPQNKHVNAKIRQTLNRFEDLFVFEDKVWRLRKLEA